MLSDITMRLWANSNPRILEIGGVYRGLRVIVTEDAKNSPPVSVRIIKPEGNIIHTFSSESTPDGLVQAQDWIEHFWNRVS